MDEVLEPPSYGPRPEGATWELPACRVKTRPHHRDAFTQHPAGFGAEEKERRRATALPDARRLRRAGSKHGERLAKGWTFVEPGMFQGLLGCWPPEIGQHLHVSPSYCGSEADDPLFGHCATSISSDFSPTSIEVPASTTTRATTIQLPGGCLGSKFISCLP